MLGEGGWPAPESLRWDGLVIHVFDCHLARQQGPQYLVQVR